VQSSLSSQAGGVPSWQVWLDGLQLSTPVHGFPSSQSESWVHRARHAPPTQIDSSPASVASAQVSPLLSGSVPSAQKPFVQASVPLQGFWSLQVSSSSHGWPASVGPASAVVAPPPVPFVPPLDAPPLEAPPLDASPRELPPPDELAESSEASSPPSAVAEDPLVDDEQA
jgi:hypothetical protein